MRILLIEERKRRNWSQQEIANLIGTTQHNISRWELGQTSPGPFFRAKLCEVFGWQPQELGLLLADQSESVSTRLAEHETTETVSVSLTPNSSCLWGIPYPRNPFFTGREDLLQHLHNVLHREHTMALTQSWAISGLGGIGKTQIALEYAYRYRQDYRFVFWSSAATRDMLQAGLVTIARLLCLSEMDDGDHKQMLAAATNWLATHQGWLLILDNADDVEVIYDAIPPERSGHLLLTTRAQALGSLAQRVNVESMGMVEAALFLLRRTKLLAPDSPLDRIHESDLTSAEVIAIEMGFLPLALDQAGAYIEEIGCSLATYLELYRTHRAELLRRRGHVSPDHPESVATTWSLNFRHVEQAKPTAADLLRLCAFLEPDAIPEELFSEGRAALDPALQALAANELQINEAIEVLRCFSLVQLQPRQQMLRLHRLVQAVLQDAMSEEDKRHQAEQVVRAINIVFPATIELATWPRCRRYLSQAQGCTALIQRFNFTFAEATSLLSRIALYLQDMTLYEQAEPLFQQIVRLRTLEMGAEHPEVALALSNLAVLYKKQGKYELAQSISQRALATAEQALGTEHLDVARSLHSLAGIFSLQGQSEQAEQLYQRALRIREQALGTEHPKTQETRAAYTELLQSRAGQSQ